MGQSDGPTEDELRRELAFHRAIETSMRVGIAAVDREGVQTYVSPAFARMLGWSVEELLGARPPYRYWPPEEAAAIEAAFARTLSDDAPADGFELRFRRKTEERFDVLVLVSPLAEDDGTKGGWLASVYDITARKRAEQQLRLGEGRLHLAMDAGRLGAWEWEVGSGRVTWSPELEAIHGLPPGGFAGTFEAFQADIHPEDRERVLGTIRDTLEQERRDYRVEYRIVLPDGRVRWLEARGRLVDDGPAGQRMIGVCSDVTEHKHARFEADRAAERLRVLAEASAVLASSLDVETALRELARTAVRHLADYAVTYMLEADGSIRRVGLAHRDPAAQPLVEALVRAGQPTIDDPHGAGAIIRTGAPVLAPEIPAGMLERAAQNEAHLAVLRELAPRSSILVPLIARGRTLGALALAATDSSGRRYGEEDLVLAEELAGRAALLVDNARLYREAQEAVRARDEMVAAVSHDLRSPLQVIRSSATLLGLPGVAPDKGERALAAIDRAVSQMERFVRDLLDVARIDAGTLTTGGEHVDVGALVGECVGVLATLADEKSVQLRVSVEGRLPSVPGDSVRLRQVLDNILGNAVEFAPSGTEVRVSALADEQEVRIAVSDAGPGIPEEQIPRLFERFWQADPSARRGTGLGLAIAKAIVDAHGGTIRVRSRVGEGSTFEVALPVSRARP